MSRAHLEQYAHTDSIIHRWHLKLKIIALFGLIFALALVQSPLLMPAVLLIAVIFFAMSKLPFRFLLNRLQYPGVFLAVMAILLPAFAGTTPLLKFGPLIIWVEGTVQFMVIACKFVAILTLTVVLFSSAPMLDTIKAVRGLGLSPILADMVFLSYRYIYELGEQLIQMQRAMRLRGFEAAIFSSRYLHTHTALIGSLLVRSYEQSERVYAAMRLRGYGQPSSPAQQTSPGVADWVLWSVTLLITLTLVAVEGWLRWRGGGWL